jgi:hypothetical protein
MFVRNVRDFGNTHNKLLKGISEQRTSVSHVLKLILAILCDSALATLLLFLLIDSVVIPHRKCRQEYTDHQAVRKQIMVVVQDRGSREAKTTHVCPVANVESWRIKVNKG